MVCLGQLCNLLLASGLHRLCAKCTISSRQQDGAAPAQKRALKIRRHQRPAGSFQRRRGVSVLRLGSARPQERTKNCFPSFSNGNKGAPTLCKSLCCRSAGVRQRSIFCGEDLPVSRVYWAVALKQRSAPDARPVLLSLTLPLPHVLASHIVKVSGD